MSLKKNILANYASQMYATVLGIVMVPLYIRYMGSEAYGMVGFFSMLQVWFGLLDMGLTPTIARETARFNGGTTDVLSYRRLVRSLEGVFLFVALIGGATLYIIAGYIASEWLKVDQIPIHEVRESLEWMGLTIAIRWMCGLYRGTISGAERLVWLSGFNALLSTIRFVLVLPVLAYVSHAPTTFFAYQLAVSIFEIVGLTVYSYRLLPCLPKDQKTSWSWAPLRPILRFSSTIAFTSSIWVLSTQTDKLVLSRILSLAEYGHFTLAVLIAGGITVICGPISSAIMPRMAKLEAEGNHAGLIKLYRESTQLVSVLAGSTSVTLAFCAEPLLWAWTGDRALANHTAPILKLYALGNGILAVAAFPFYLQYAKGNLRLHFIGNAIFIVLLIPAIIWGTINYGAIGAGYVWLGINAFSLIAWLPLVHRAFEPGLNYLWYRDDVFKIWIPIYFVGLMIDKFYRKSSSLISAISFTLVFGLLVGIVGIISSGALRYRISSYLNRT
jgi:O-antigen/teichoic acid export membrane protein